MTYLHKFKCLNCRLHFIVCSWYKDIGPVYCPECGIKDNNFHWVEEVNHPIFEIVPGPTPPPGFIKESNQPSVTPQYRFWRKIFNYIHFKFSKT